MANDAHASPPSRGRGQELLYDPNAPSPTHAERARTLASSVKIGTLCTVALDPAGFPYGSFVTYALDGGTPIFLVSELAEHTKNLRADERVSMLVAEPGGDDPLARGRVTLLGRCRPVPDAADTAGDDATLRERTRAAYLAAHPNAA